MVISPFAVQLFSLPFSSHCSTQNIGFNDSGYVFKPPQPRSAVHGAPSLTWYPQNLHRLIVFHVSFWEGGLRALFGGLSPPKLPSGDGTGFRFRTNYQNFSGHDVSLVLSKFLWPWYIASAFR